MGLDLKILDNLKTSDVTIANGGLPRKSGRAVIRRTHKYNAQPKIVDGIRFDSKAEARRYIELKQLEATGDISDLELQPEYELQPGFIDGDGVRVRAIKYRADFLYIQEGRWIVEDVKGAETPVFKLKRKLFLYKYPELKLLIT